MARYSITNLLKEYSYYINLNDAVPKGIAYLEDPNNYKTWKELFNFDITSDFSEDEVEEIIRKIIEEGESEDGQFKELKGILGFGYRTYSQEGGKKVDLSDKIHEILKGYRSYIGGYYVRILKEDHPSGKYPFIIYKRNIKFMNEVIDAFGDVTKKTLKSKSAQSLKDMLGGKSFMQAAQDSMQMLPQLMAIEKPYRDQLDVLAKEIVYRMFPIIEQAGIQVDAKLVDSPNDMKITKQGKEEEAEPDDLDAVADKAGIDKRRIINSITQGAGIRGTKAYYMFDEVLNSLDPELISKYDQLVGDSYGIYDDDNAIAMMMAMLSQGQGSQGGESEVEWNDEDDTMTIKARALTFPILLQEIVKGLYEFVSLQGFSDDAEKNKQIVQKVDKATNEPEDIRYGKFIYDALRDLAADLDIENEMFFKEVYQLPEADFKIFIENALNDQLTSDQKRWVEETPNRLEQEEDE